MFQEEFDLDDFEDDLDEELLPLDDDWEEYEDMDNFDEFEEEDFDEFND